jgi:tRNA-dihydrouridine synthase B
VNVPVTLKTRTGWSSEHKNVHRIAHIAQQCGIQALTVHGRTRDQKYFGSAEYDTIQSLKQTLSIPLIANGDIDSVKKAKMVMDITGADAIMVGRAAQSRPWIFHQINTYLKDQHEPAEPDLITRKNWLFEHLNNLYEFYGEVQGVRIARKHIDWQLGRETGYSKIRHKLMAAEAIDQQTGLINQFFQSVLIQRFDRAC